MPLGMAVALFILAVVVLGVGWALFDLAHHDVWYLPKWAWAVVIVLLSMPIGIGIYAVAGRVGRRGHPLLADVRRQAVREQHTNMVLGMVLGIAIGVALDQLYIWFPLGLALGLALDEQRGRSR